MDLNTGSSAEAGPSKLRHASSRPPPSSTDPAKLLTPGAVRRALTQLNAHSQQVDDDLSRTVSSSLQRITTSQQSISSLAPQIDLLSEEANVLRSRLVDAARTSDRITGAVRVLDDEKKRLAIARAWLTATQDLKASLSTLSTAIDQGDWELATRHAQKAMSVPPEVINSEFAARVVPSTEQPLTPAQTLLELREKLLAVFTQRFHHATMESRDEAEASRFFRLFPLVGWRSEGLDAYSTFARGMIREKGKAILTAAHRGNVPHAQLLTALFEQLALLIDTHQAVVDRHYGDGNFAAGVMPGLQDECDEIGLKIIEGWVETTQVMRRLTEARAYKFSYLANLGAAGASTASSSSGGGGANKFGIPGRPSTPLGRPGTPAAGGARASMDEPQMPDGREVDRLLHELASMAARWATYRRFLKGRLTSERVDAKQDAIAADAGGFKDFHRRSSIDGSAIAAAAAGASKHDSTAAATIKADVVTASKLLSTSALAHRFDSLLSDVYCPLERWYLRSSLEKAHRIDTCDPSTRPLTSSILDDAFFLLRASATRILSTCHPATIGTALRGVRIVADDDYAQVLVRRMEAVWRSVGGALAGPDGPRKETATREMRAHFVRYLNVLGVSVRYAERILADLGSEAHLESLFPGGDDDDDEEEEDAANVPSDLPRNDKGLARHHLTTHLSALPSRLRSAQRTELEHLFQHVTRPRLRTLLFADVFREVRYDVRTEEEYAAAEDKDWVRRRFARGWDAIVAAPFRETFDEDNYDEYVGLAVEAFVRPWEKAMVGAGNTSSSLPAFTRFTELGALRFDKDWRAVAAHVGEQTKGGGGASAVRDKFARIAQIAYVLCLDEDEDDEALGATAVSAGDEKHGSHGIYEAGATSGFSWRLSASEVKAVRALRVT